MKPYLSVILEANDSLVALPLSLIDLDNCFSELELSYEVIILSTSKDAEIIAKKIGRIIKETSIRVIDPDPAKISHLEINGSYGLLVKSMEIPTIDCIRSIVQSLDNDDLRQSNELVLGFHKEGGISFINILGRLIGSPVRLEAEHLVIGFNKNISASVLNIKKFGREHFDIELAMLSKKLGYKIKEIPLEFRKDEPVTVNYRNRFNLLLSVIKMKLAPSGLYEVKKVYKS